MIIKYSKIIFKYTFLIFLAFSLSVNLTKSDEISIEEVTIKKRKAVFSKNYSTAKKVQTLTSKNYLGLISLFPDNTREGFKTEALPSIWQNKNEFNNLMTKSSEDMVKLAAIIETVEDVKISLNEMMWKNCKTCHSKFRAPH